MGVPGLVGTGLLAAAGAVAYKTGKLDGAIEKVKTTFGSKKEEKPDSSKNPAEKPEEEDDQSNLLKWILLAILIILILIFVYQKMNSSSDEEIEDEHDLEAGLHKKKIKVGAEDARDTPVRH